MFVIEIRTINLIDGGIMRHYQGRDGYVRSTPYYCKGWQKKAYAQKEIEQEIAVCCFESGLNEYVNENCYFQIRESKRMFLTTLNVIWVSDLETAFYRGLNE